MNKLLFKSIVAATLLSFTLTSCNKIENPAKDSSSSRLKATTILRSNPVIGRDAGGNTIIAWLDNRNGGNYDIYAQKLDGSGKKLWSATDVRVNSDAGTSTQYFATLAVDVSGNTIIAWQDYRNGNYDIYAQKLNSAGAKLWSADVRVNSDNTKTSQLQPVLAVDGSGNTLIAWLDKRTGASITAQKLGPNGNKLWAADVSVTTSFAYDCAIAADASGNAIVTWSNANVYAQKLSVSGSKLWAETLVGPILTYVNAVNSRVAVDASGNIIVSWEGEYASNYGPYIQKLNTSGTKQWAQEKSVSAVNPMLGDQAYQNMTVDKSGNILVVWEDWRTYNIFLIAQKLDTNGNRLWGASDVLLLAVCGQTNPAIISDASGNSIITWMDNRNGNANLCIFAQKLNTSGAKQWTKDIQVNY